MSQTSLLGELGKLSLLLLLLAAGTPALIATDNTLLSVLKGAVPF
jgi:hypothetical protein